MHMYMDASMIVAETSSPAAAPHLLTLPGELRSRIYEVIIADEKPKKIRITQKWRIWPPLKKSTDYVQDHHPSRQYLGLTQTNRLLRTEFMPLYTKARRLFFSIDGVLFYLDAFPLPDVDLTSSIITVLRELRYSESLRNKSAGSSVTLVTDLLPLLYVDYNTFPFLISSARSRARKDHQIDARVTIPHQLLRAPYHDVVQEELRGDVIAAIYLHRHYSGQWYLDNSMTMCLSAKIDSEASDEAKLEIFRRFVERSKIREVHRIRIGCVSGGFKMMAPRFGGIYYERLKNGA